MFRFPEAPGVRAKSISSPGHTERRSALSVRRSRLPTNAISHPVDAAIDFTVDRFSDSFAGFFEPSTTMTRTESARSRSWRVKDRRHRPSGSGLSAVVTPTVVIGVPPLSRRGSAAKVGSLYPKREMRQGENCAILYPRVG
jgi:hypothetical protein